MNRDNPRLRRGPWLLAGIGLYVVFLVAAAPATLLTSRLSAITGNGAQILRSAGTFWNGSGVLVANIPDREPMTIPLKWTINPLWLVTGQMRIHLTGNGTETDIDTVARLGYRRVVLEVARVELPAQALSLFYPPATLFAPRGHLHLQSEYIELDGDGLHGSANLTWSGAGIRMAGATGLGEFRAELAGQGPVANVRLTTVRGPLLLNAEGNWRVLGDGELALRGTLALSVDAPNSLAPVVNLAGPDGLNVRAYFPVFRILGWQST